MLFNGEHAIFAFGNVSMFFNGEFALCQFPMLFHGNLRLERLGGGCMDGRTDGRMEIHPCVLQDISSLRPLPKKKTILPFL